MYPAGDLSTDAARVAVTPPAPDDGEGRSEYRVLANTVPQVILRILGLFAQLDMLPRRVRMDVVDDMIWVALTVDGLTQHRAEIIAAKLRALIDTEVVDLTWAKAPR